MRPPPPARGRAGGLSPTQSDTLLLGSELESVKALSALACHEHEHSRAPGCLSRRDAGLHILRRTNSVIGDRDQHIARLQAFVRGIAIGIYARDHDAIDAAVQIKGLPRFRRDGR